MSDTLPLDFDALRQRALGKLQLLAGSTWTDHNTHDPGITLLEQLCYALTDLGYRTGFPVADLLAETGRAGAGLFTPSQVLPGGPVTLDDLRRLVVDLPGVANAWVERVEQPLARHDAAQGLLWADAGGTGSAAVSASPNVTPVSPRGLYRVRIDKSVFGADVDGGLLARQAVTRLQTWRGLGEDMVDVAVLDRQMVALDAALAIAPGRDGAEVLADVYATIARYLSPPLHFRSLRELLDAGWPVDRIFEGPPMTRGLLDPDEWAASSRRDSVRLSDLIRELTAVPGVQAVKSLAFVRDGRVVNDWLLNIAPDRSARFDLDNSRLRLERAGLRIDHGAMRATARALYEMQLRRSTMEPPEGADDGELAPPVGRLRGVGDYLSVQHHLPAVYGVGPAGLSAEEPPERQAWARQLKAYLLIFDQLLANQHAQLAHAARLLSFDDDGAAVRFAQPVPDDGGALQLDSVRLGTADQQTAWLDDATRDPWGDDLSGDRALAHRHRLVDHLLARLGEDWGEQRPVPDVDDPLAVPATQRLRDLRRKQAWLRDYPQLSVRRGIGVQAMPLPGQASTPPGLVQRLARQLGWSDDDGALTAVEHILLRPLPGDAFQQGPLMRGVAQRDPFSLQLSLVLPDADPRLADPDLRQRLRRMLEDAAPAHLAVRLLWLDAPSLTAFRAAYVRWQDLAAAARRRAYGLDDAPDADTGAADHQTALRSARNRVIDALGLGDTFPLTDLTVADGKTGTDPIKVAFGRTAKIAIDDAEAGVRYELRGPGGLPLRDAKGNLLPAVAADGADGRLLLESPPVTDNITYRLQATKLRMAPGLAPQAPVLLAQTASVSVGLDTKLVIEVADLPLLDATLADPKPADVRLADWGTRVKVLVRASQEGVAYRLVLDGVVQTDNVIGNLDTVQLQSPPLAEDTTLAVQATKVLVSGSGTAEQQLLEARLRVAVRADTSAAVQAMPGAVVDYRSGAAVLRLARSQASAGYRVWLRRLGDAEWLRAPVNAAVLSTGVAGLAVAADAAPRSAVPPVGFSPAGNALVPGNGGVLDLPLGAPADDVVCLVQATKQHASGAATVPTDVLLNQAVVLLVRPDPAPALQLTWVQPVAGVPLQLRVAGGQAGVFYALRPTPDAASLGLPAYMHQADAGAQGPNKGIERLAIGIDFAVAATPDPEVGLGSASVQSPDLRRPAAPLLDLPAVPDGSTLALRAIKAQTGIEQPLPATLQLPAAAAQPQVQLEAAWVAPGAEARVSISATDATQRWQLWRNGQPLADAVPGNGAALKLSAGAATADGRYVVRMTPAGAAKALTLAREWVLAVRLLPRADLAWAPRRSTLASGESTEVVVTASQPGVVYQLMAQGVAVGTPVAGNGDTIALPTGPITAAVRLTVTAQRPDGPSPVVTLAGDATVSLLA